MIAIISALEEEIKSIHELIEVKTEKTIGSRKYYIGQYKKKDIVFVYSKCGKVAAATTVTTLINVFGATKIIFTGVAGAIDAKLKVGDIVIGSGLVQHDFDVSELLGFDKYDNSLLGRSVFEANFKNYEKILEEIKKQFLNKIESEISEEVFEEYNIKNPSVVSGVIASGDQFISSAEKAQELREGIANIKCVEMEGAAAAQVCYEYNTELLVIRIISDNADADAKYSFDSFVSQIASNYTKVLLELILQFV